MMENVCREIMVKDNRCTELVSFYTIVISNNTASANAHLAPDLVSEDWPNDEAKSSITTMNAGYDISLNDNHSSSRPLLNEVLAPIRTLLNTRVSRGILSEVELMTEFPKGNTMRFQLRDPSEQNKIPLGWVLSQCTQIQIRKQAYKNVEYYAKLLDQSGIVKAPTPDENFDLDKCNR